MKSKKQVKKLLKDVEISICILESELERDQSTVDYINLLAAKRERTAQKKILQDVLK